VEQAQFDRVAALFGEFHKEFAPLFGRREVQARGEQYLRGLLVQQTDRRNAENVAESIDGASPRALQRFLSESPWDTDRMMERLQRYLAVRLNAPDGVFVIDETGFPKQGTKSVGVARQYCGTLGKVANCQMGVFLGYASSRGHLLVDKRLYLPRKWIEDPQRCRDAGVPQQVGSQTKAELALSMLRQAKTWGHLDGTWVTGDEAYGQVPQLRDVLDTDGWWYVLEVPSNTLVWEERVEVALPEYSGHGRKPTVPRVAGDGTPKTVRQLAEEVDGAAWQQLEVAQGSQGPRVYRFASLRVWESRDGLPGRECWLVLRTNVDGTEPKYYLSNAPNDTALRELGRVGALRWTVETEFQTSKGETGLDEYEVRGWTGWQHHITLALLAGAFLLSLQQAWGGKDAPDYAPADQPGAARTAAETRVQPRGVVPVAPGHTGTQRARQTLPRQTQAQTA